MVLFSTLYRPIMFCPTVLAGSWAWRFWYATLRGRSDVSLFL